MQKGAEVWFRGKPSSELQSGMCELHGYKKTKILLQKKKKKITEVSGKKQIS